MQVPDSVPVMIEYRMGLLGRRPVVRTALPRRPVEAVGSNGQTNAAIVCPQIPIGAFGWRLPGETEWKPISDIPGEWWPFVNRPRPSEMDFRSR